MKTRITELFGIRYPIIQGGMHFVGFAELAAAVSNAGGLGIITGLTQRTPEDLAREIAKCRSMTDQPFGVNLTFLPVVNQPDYPGYLRVILEGGVKIVETAGNNPQKWLPALQEAGVKVIHKCTSVRHSLKAEAIGCDAVSVDGFECGGHPGEDDVPNFILLPRAADELKIPFVASGGMADGRSLAAALSLGADGINMGTRFLATQEAPVHQNVKDAIVRASELDTRLVMRPLRNTERVLNNAATERLLAKEKELGAALKFDDIFGEVAGVYPKIMIKGEMDAGVWSCGMVAGLIHDVPTCQQLIDRIVADARAIIGQRLAAMVGVSPMPAAFIVAAARTAAGRRNGRLSGWHPVDLAATVLDALVDRSGIDPAAVDDVLMGCVMQVGEQAINVARNAVLASRLPESVPGTSIDRQCGSSQQALQFAAQAVMSGTQDVVIAAGVEGMTRVPMFTSSDLPRKNGLGFYMSPRIRQRYPDVEFSQFMGAELLARKYGLSKDQLDAYSLQSHQRARDATQAGRFAGEIVPVSAWKAGEEGPSAELHTVDEGIRMDATLEGIAGVKLLQEGGVITAASASQIADGAAGLLVVSEKALKTFGLRPMARIHHLSAIGGDPVVMLEAPIPATVAALKKAGLKVQDIDAFEVNEAFAPVPLAWLQVTGADPGRLNVNGGAIALGHPLGASGAKLMTTLLHVLQQRNGRYGLQTMCEGGGMANVTIVEYLR